MKKVFILALIAIATGTSAFAGPSSKVIDHFSANFAKAKNVSWNSTDFFDKVSFVMDKEKVDAYYDPTGELIGSSRTFAFDKLPKNALETITTKYTFPDFKVKDCIQYTDGNNETNYYVSMEKATENITLKITTGGIVRVFSKAKK